jgi:hypothetical protein
MVLNRPPPFHPRSIPVPDYYMHHVRTGTASVWDLPLPVTLLYILSRNDTANVDNALTVSFMRPKSLDTLSFRRNGGDSPS